MNVHSSWCQSVLSTPVYFHCLLKAAAYAQHKTVFSLHTAEAALSAIGTEGRVCNARMAAKGRRRRASKQYRIAVYSSQNMMQWCESKRHRDRDSAYYYGYQRLAMRKFPWHSRSASEPGHVTPRSVQVTTLHWCRRVTTGSHNLITLHTLCDTWICLINAKSSPLIIAKTIADL